MSRPARLRLAFAGLHPDRRRNLVERLGSAEAVLAGLTGGRIRASRSVRTGAGLSEGQCRHRLEILGVRALFREDPDYPPHLSGLPDAPDVLFVRGALSLRAGVAIVGTRSCTRYGRSLALAYGRAAAEAGWPVISGLARGIDGEAHRGTVAGRGVGVAVLGSGPDVVYPGEHRPLLRDLLAAGGGMVTEYPPGTPPEGWRFPPRNRIIAGLAAAVVVVEAAATGGALITAGMAAELGRTVLAVPGDVDRPTSVGCNLLIRDGAVPVMSPDDFTEAVSLVLGPPRRRPSGPDRPADSDALVAALGAAGLGLEEAALAWGMDAATASATASRLEVAGLARWEAGVLCPGDR